MSSLWILLVAAAAVAPSADAFIPILNPSGLYVPPAANAVCCGANCCGTKCCAGSPMGGGTITIQYDTTHWSGTATWSSDATYQATIMANFALGFNKYTVTESSATIKTPRTFTASYSYGGNFVLTNAAGNTINWAPRTAANSFTPQDISGTYQVPTGAVFTIMFDTNKGVGGVTTDDPQTTGIITATSANTYSLTFMIMGSSTAASNCFFDGTNLQVTGGGANNKFAGTWKGFTASNLSGRWAVNRSPTSNIQLITIMFDPMRGRGLASGTDDFTYRAQITATGTNTYTIVETSQNNPALQNSVTSTATLASSKTSLTFTRPDGTAQTWTVFNKAG